VHSTENSIGDKILHPANNTSHPQK